MIEAISEWAVGFIVTMLFVKLCKFRASGFLAVVVLTIIPYGLGVFLFSIFGVKL